MIFMTEFFAYSVMLLDSTRGSEGGPRSAWAAAALALMLGIFEFNAIHPAMGAERTGCKAELLAYALSPNGDRIAEVVRPTNSPDAPERIVYGTLGGETMHWRLLFEGPAILNLKWLNKETIAFIQNRSGGSLLTENVVSHRIRRLVVTRTPIMDYMPNSRGNEILYSFQESSRTSAWVSTPVPDRIGVTTVALPSWATNAGVASDFMEARTAVGLWSGRDLGIVYSTNLGISQLAWIGAGSHVRPAVLQYASENSPWEKSLIDLAGRHEVVDQHRLEAIALIARSKSGLLAIVSPGPPSDRFESTEPVRLYVMTKDGHLNEVHFGANLAQAPAWIPRIWWLGETRLLVDVEGTDRPGGPNDHRLLEVDWKTGEVVETVRWPNGSLDNCQVSGEGATAVCDADKLTEEGRLVKVDLKSGRITKLAALSPCVRSLGISFRDITVRNESGRLSTGFLALPDSKETGSQGATGGTPLAIMLYGFNRTFAADGQWIRAYPVSSLVSAGIGVLLLNLPRAASWRRGDAVAARRELLEEPLSTVEEAPAAVAATGVKVGRVMVMGWSWGGFIAAHAIEESCRFVAAEVGDPASYNIAGYVLGNSTMRGYADTLFGGPPDARYIENYVAFDPERSGTPPKGPIMLEFVSRNLAVGQYLEEWRAAGAYVEAFAYHYSPHALTVPMEAQISRERNLLWAELNLLPRRRPDPVELSAVGLTIPPKFAYRCH